MFRDIALAVLSCRDAIKLTLKVSFIQVVVRGLMLVHLKSIPNAEYLHFYLW